MIAALESTVKPIQWMSTWFQTNKTANRKKSRFNCLAAATNQLKGYNLKQWRQSKEQTKLRKCSQVGWMKLRTESNGIQSTKDLKPFWKAGTNGNQAEPNTRRRISNRKKGRDRTELAEIWSQKETLTDRKGQGNQKKDGCYFKLMDTSNG
jgi:hypothetical protein